MALSPSMDTFTSTTLIQSKDFDITINCLITLKYKHTFVVVGTDSITVSYSKGDGNGKEKVSSTEKGFVGCSKRIRKLKLFPIEGERILESVLNNKAYSSKHSCE